MTAILTEAGVNIRALALADTSDFGVLRLIVDNKDKAIDALKDNGFTVGKTQVLAVEVEDGRRQAPGHRSAVPGSCRP